MLDTTRVSDRNLTLMWMKSDSLKIYCCMNYTTMIVTLNVKNLNC